MEGKYVLIKRGKRIYLSYFNNGKTYTYASVHERHREFIHLITRGNEIYDIITVMRTYILMKMLPRVKDVVRATDVVRDLRDFEVLFWYVKFAKTPNRAIKAFKALYGLR